MLKNTVGLVRDSNPGPLAPKARIIPLDQRADILHPYQVYKNKKIKMFTIFWENKTRDHLL